MRKKFRGGKCGAAFGTGLIVAMILPSEWLVAILALILIGTGLCCLR